MRLHKQLEFLFTQSEKTREPGGFSDFAAIAAAAGLIGKDSELTKACVRLARELRLPKLGRKVEVYWNARLKTTAGLADCRTWRIDLNPRLVEFAPEEPMHTLRHELAHLVAQERAGRKRLRAHGIEWRQACADLGIPNEPAYHCLPWPRNRRPRHWAYTCPSCGTVLERVKRIRYVAACYDCCRKHNRGAFSPQFRLKEAAL